MWTRALLKTRAKAVLRQSYWKAFLVSLVIAFVGGNSAGGSFNFNFGILLVFAFRVFLGYPLEVGGRRYFIRSAENTVDMNHLGFAFEKPLYFAIIKSMLWRAFINFLWYLLLIIPGIIMSYAYRMVPYILADNPEIGYKRALELSTQMTDGQKFDIFVLDLSFIGWYLLGILAFFIGVIFVLPYQNATEAELYLVLRQDALDNGFCSYDELLLEA